MRFVHIEDFFHPDAGYQLNSLAPLQRLQGHEVTIVTAELEKLPAFITKFFGTDNIGARDARFESDTGVRIVRLPIYTYYSGRAIFHPTIFRRVRDLEPDVAFIHGEDTLTGMAFIKLASRLPYPLVLDCHMVEMASENPLREQFRAFYRRFVTPTILRENIPLIRVVDSNFVEKCLGIPLSHTRLLSFGTDTVRFCPDKERGQAARKELGLSAESFVVIYAGKLDPNKGAMFLASALADPIVSSRGDPIEFLIIGTAAGDYGGEVELQFQRSHNKIVRLPTQPFPSLAKFYQCADLAVFPKQCSMSFFEAQSCGVPVLFERNEINDQRVQGRNAFAFTPDDVDSFRAGVARLASLDSSSYDECREASRAYIVENFDYVPIAQQFSAIMLEAHAKWVSRKRHAA
jgi:glycosyltransferase involved in cell wall biosynthesis